MRTVVFMLVGALSIFSSVQCRRVVCYFPDWAGYRDGDGKYTPNDLDYSKCTNVLYAFARLSSDSVSIKPADSQVDNNENFYKQIVDKGKAAKAKPSLSLGGWSDSGSNKYSILLNDKGKRIQFVKNAVAFLEKYGFEGLDLDVEYPTCPQENCNGGNPNDRSGYSGLIKELSEAFKPKGWVLSAAISADPSIIDRAYPINDMNKYMDWVGVMTYDYHTSSEKETGPVSPLKTAPGDKFPDSNTEKSIEHLISKGADKTKLLVGVPFYGVSYKLSNPSNHGYWAPSSGKGVSGPFTKNNDLAYYEICDFMKQGYKNVENDDLGAYIYKDNNWISYNSEKDVLNKVNYVKQSNLGGVIVWDVSLDDFKGKYCGKGKNPLLTTIKNNIG